MTCKLKAGANPPAGVYELIVTTNTDARGKIKLWSDQKKTTKYNIANPIPITLTEMQNGRDFYVEGQLESGAEREIVLNLKFTATVGGAVDQDDLNLSVSPIILNYEVVEDDTVTIDVVEKKVGGVHKYWAIQPSTPNANLRGVTVLVDAVTTGSTGVIDMGQTVGMVNTLGGGKGAKINNAGAGVAYDFGTYNTVNYATQMINDSPASTNIPMVLATWNSANTLMGFNDGPGVMIEGFVNSIIPDAGKTTPIDVTIKAMNYPLIYYQKVGDPTKDVVYFLGKGKEPWSIRIAGDITRGAGGDPVFTKNNKTKITVTKGFVHDNTVPTNVNQKPCANEISDSKPDWR